MTDSYLWIKAAHVLSVVAWMAGLFYLPRLFVYHSTSEVGGEVSELFKVMERRLLRGIMRPAALAVAIFGMWGGLSGGWFASLDTWFLLKLAVVAMLYGFHGLLERHVVEFRGDLRLRSSGYFRAVNEIPTVLLIVIVVLVIVKPF